MNKEICPMCENSGIGEYVDVSEVPIGETVSLNDLPIKLGPCPDCSKGKEIAQMWLEND